MSSKTDPDVSNDIKHIKAGKTLTLRDLLWPTDSMLKKKIAISSAFLIISKVATIAIPMCMSAMIDIMAGANVTNSGLFAALGMGNMASTQFGKIVVFILHRSKKCNIQHRHGKNRNDERI
eukprot:XP_001611620.1 hypothetical protein [Babesia bovis T2Bo]